MEESLFESRACLYRILQLSPQKDKSKGYSCRTGRCQRTVMEESRFLNGQSCCRGMLRGRGWGVFLCLTGALAFWSCSTLSGSYRIGKRTDPYRPWASPRGLPVPAWARQSWLYKIGEFSFRVVMAPLDWPLTRRGNRLRRRHCLPKRRLSRTGSRMQPYVVHGKRYVPMSVDASKSYREVGIASWYGYETWRKEGRTHDGER
jgi:hypothetical protein